MESFVEYYILSWFYDGDIIILIIKEVHWHLMGCFYDGILWHYGMLLRRHLEALWDVSMDNAVGHRMG